MSGGHRGRSRIVALVACVASTACGTDPVDPFVELSASATSTHFEYHWTPGDEPPDTVYQERHLAWLVSKLGVEPSQPLVYLKYRDQQQLAELTGHTQGTGFAEPGTYRFHTVWPKDNHEYIHAIITAEIGTPPAFLNEGVAVAHHGASFTGPLDGDPLWNGSPVRPQVRSLRDSGLVPALDVLLENLPFQQIDGGVSYPVAGSFVRYLIDEEGPEKLLLLVSRSPRDASKSSLRTIFRDVYGVEIDGVWAEWLAWL